MWIYRCPSDDENSWNTTEECRDLLFTKPAADSKRKSTLYSYCCFCLLACAQTGNGNAIYRSTVDQAKKTQYLHHQGKTFVALKAIAEAAVGCTVYGLSIFDYIFSAIIRPWSSRIDYFEISMQNSSSHLKLAILENNRLLSENSQFFASYFEK